MQVVSCLHYGARRFFSYMIPFNIVVGVFVMIAPTLSMRSVECETSLLAPGKPVTASHLSQ